MADRREERERLRQERLAAQQRMSADERRRQIMGYGVAGLLVAIVIVGIIVVVAAGGGGGEGEGGGGAPENAFVVPDTGTTAGLEFDGRDGTAPPPPRNLNLRVVARGAGCDLRRFRDEGNTHVRDGARVSYDTNPPTSGNHFATALADGAYREYPEPGNIVHMLEHGRVQIQYSPDLSERRQLLLKGLFEEDPRGMSMFPNPRMPSQVAATVWRNSLTCRRWDDRVIDAIRAFRDEYRGTAAPEQVPF